MVQRPPRTNAAPVSSELGPAQVGEILELMVKHGATRVVCGALTIERPLPPLPEPKSPPSIVDEFEQRFNEIKRKPSDGQDAALMLQRLRATG